MRSFLSEASRLAPRTGEGTPKLSCSAVEGPLGELVGRKRRGHRSRGQAHLRPWDGQIGALLRHRGAEWGPDLLPRAPGADFSEGRSAKQASQEQLLLILPSKYL